MSEVSKTVLFFNPFADFTGYWDSVAYPVRHNQKQYVPDWLAESMTKHLVDRELNRLGLPTDFKCSDPANPNYGNSRERLVAKCIISESGVSEALSPTAQQVEIMNKTRANEGATSELTQKPWCDSCASRGVRHMKECPKALKKDSVPKLNPVT